MADEVFNSLSNILTFEGLVVKIARLILIYLAVPTYILQS